MEVNIGEVNSTVRATDSRSLLSVEVLECIVRAVMERLREEEGHRQRTEAERRLSSGIATEED
jgi:hypothetical protein